MNKHEFLRELLQSLSQLPEAERDKAYSFYAEIIDDSMEDGMSEEEAVQKLGGMDDIVERIIAETPMAALIKARVERKNGRVYMILLLVLGFPVWFPLLTAALSVALTLFVVFWTVALVLWAVFASAAAAALGSCAAMFFVSEFGLRLMFLGGALACAGGAMPLYKASLEVTRQFARLTNWLWKKLKNSLVRKGSKIL